MEKNEHEDRDPRSVTLPVPDEGLPRIVVIGAGFGGLSFLQELDTRLFQVVVIDRNNFHQFQPLFYQVAMSALPPDSIVFPIRKQIGRKTHSYFVYGEVEGIDPSERTVYTDQGGLSYERLIIATGATPTFFGLKEVEENALTMKDLRGALNIRHFMLESLEKAAVVRDDDDRELYTNFVIVGGGPTGVELAGSLAEFKRYILPRDYPEYSSRFMKVCLIEMGDRLLGSMSDKASSAALKHLTKMGVEVRLGEAVEHYDGRTARTSKGDEIPARTFIWTAGVKGYFPDGVPEAKVVKGNRLEVDENLRIKGYEDLYAIGDAAAMCSERDPFGHPQLAQPAIQQGRYLAKSFKAEQRGKLVQPFEYKDKGVMATIGTNRAVADIGRWKFNGFLAWLIWSLVHLIQISGFRNRFLVGLSWAWSYFSYERGDRLIIRKYRKEE